MYQSYSLFIVIVILITGCAAPPLKDTSTLPVEFSNSIPMNLRGDMRLLEIRQYQRIKDQSRSILYLNSYTGQHEAKGEVSLLDGYRVMYGVPGTAFFANTHIDKSMPGEYQRDFAIILGARWHNHREQVKHLRTALEENREYREQFESQLSPGQKLIIYKDDSYKNYQYVSSHASVLGLTGGVMGMVSIFNPRDEIIITAYILRYPDSKYRNIDEFEVMLNDFIEGYIDFISTH